MTSALRKPLPHPRHLLWLALLLAGCQNGPTDQVSTDALMREPLHSQAFHIGDTPGLTIFSQHYRVSTTVRDPLYQRLILRVLEAAYARSQQLNAGATVTPPGGFFDCYVFGDRHQWELYTKLNLGLNASTYLQINAGGYCQGGVFAGYDIGREMTLSVIAHEAWHQYASFAFKNRLPAWLDEGIATQNEAMDWDGATPAFDPQKNFRRFTSLQAAVREHRLWALRDLLPTHAGEVVGLSQKYVDAYYAQVWALLLFLENSDEYRPKLIALLKGAREGTLTACLAGSRATPDEIAKASAIWNQVAGPRYLAVYIDQDLFSFEKKYVDYVNQLSASYPPKIK